MRAKSTLLLLLLVAIYALVLSCVTKVQTIQLTRDPRYAAAEGDRSEAGPSDVSAAGPAVSAPQPESESKPAPIAGAAVEEPRGGSEIAVNAGVAARLKALEEKKRSSGLTVSPVVTVLDLQSQGLSQMDAVFVGDYLSGCLYQTTVFRVIDRRQRDIILKEMEFTLADCTDESCQLRVGRMLAADKIVVGNVGKIGSRFILNVRLIDVETAETVSSSDTLYRDLDALLDDCLPVSITLTEKFMDKP